MATGNGSTRTPRARIVAWGGGPFVDLREIATMLRRHRRWWAGMALVGFLVGAAMSVILPRPYTATTTILLGHPIGSDPAKSIDTDTRLVTTNRVARAAMDDLGLGGSVPAFASQYHGTVVSDDLISIAVKAPSSAEARRISEVVATEFLAVRRKVFERQRDLAIKDLRGQEAKLQTELSSLTVSIGQAKAAADGPNAGADAKRQVDQLTARSADVASQIASLEAGVQNTTNSTAQRVDGSQVVDRADPGRSSLIVSTAKNVASGTAAGLAIGLALSVIIGVTSNRLWRRREIAAALQAPVPLSVASLRLRSWPSARHVATALWSPTPDLATLVDFTRNALSRPRSGLRTVTLVSVESIGATSLIALAIASELARRGIRTAVADPGGCGVVGALVGLPAGGGAPEGGPAGLVTVVSPGESADAGRRPDVDVSTPFRCDGIDALPPVDVVLVVASLDPASGASWLRPWGEHAIAVVTAGRSSAETLFANAAMLEASGVHLGAALLVGDSPYDDSVGTVVGTLNVVTPAIESITPASSSVS